MCYTVMINHKEKMLQNLSSELLQSCHDEVSEKMDPKWIYLDW